MFLMFVVGLFQPTSSDDFSRSLPTLPVSVAETNTAHWDRPIRVCGRVTDEFEGYFVLVGRPTRYLLVEPAPDPRPTEEEVCLTGVVQRRDGFTLREAARRGLPSYGVEHTLNDSVVLRPCSDAASCAEIARGRGCDSR